MGTTTTPNFNLVKPDGDEYVDVEVINRNMDLLDTAVRNMIKVSHPVGSIYMSVNPTNPDNAGGDFAGYGMTWVAFGAGRVPVGVDSTHDVEGTGGNANVTLSVNNLPAHTHNVSGDTGTESNGHVHNFNWSGSHSHSTSFVGTRQASMQAGGRVIMRDSSQADAGTGFSLNTDSKTISINKNTEGESATHTHSFNVDSSSVGSGVGFNIEQPWIGVYMWKRVA